MKKSVLILAIALLLPSISIAKDRIIFSKKLSKNSSITVLKSDLFGTYFQLSISIEKEVRTLQAYDYDSNNSLDFISFEKESLQIVTEGKVSRELFVHESDHNYFRGDEYRKFRIRFNRTMKLPTSDDFKNMRYTQNDFGIASIKNIRSFAQVGKTLDSQSKIDRVQQLEHWIASVFIFLDHNFQMIIKQKTTEQVFKDEAIRLLTEYWK